eukprot:1158190-Pelagomonas_calceolata.AAC.2
MSALMAGTQCTHQASSRPMHPPGTQLSTLALVALTRHSMHPPVKLTLKCTHQAYACTQMHSPGTQGTQCALSNYCTHQALNTPTRHASPPDANDRRAKSNKTSNHTPLRCPLIAEQVGIRGKNNNDNLLCPPVAGQTCKGKGKLATIARFVPSHCRTNVHQPSMLCTHDPHVAGAATIWMPPLGEAEAAKAGRVGCGSVMPAGMCVHVCVCPSGTPFGTVNRLCATIGVVQSCVRRFNALLFFPPFCALARTLNPTCAAEGMLARCVEACLRVCVFVCYYGNVELGRKCHPCVCMARDARTC